MLQKHPQLCEQGATVWVTSGRIPEREKSVIYERLQNAALSTEKHEDSSRHKKDFIAGDELQNVLLVRCKLIEEIPHKHEAVGSHSIKDLCSVSSGMEQRKEEDGEYAHGDGVGIDEDE